MFGGGWTPEGSIDGIPKDEKRELAGMRSVYWLMSQVGLSVSSTRTENTVVLLSVDLSHVLLVVLLVPFHLTSPD